MIKKFLFSCFALLWALSPLQAQQKQIMNNTWGYSYNHSIDLTHLSYQDILATNVTNAVFVYGSYINFDDVDFKNNTSSALYIHSAADHITLNNVYFYHNTSGGLLLGNREQSISNARFENNSSESNGGGVYVFNKNTLQANNAVFSGNSASKGGAVYAATDFTLRGGNITFSNNTAAQGGGIYAANNLTLLAENGDITFTHNTGGGIYIGSTTAKLSLLPSAGGNIIFNDDILSPALTQIDIAGTQGGEVHFNQALSNAQVNLKSGGVYLNPSVNWYNTPLQAQGGRLVLADGLTRQLHLGRVQLNDALHITPEVDLQNATMDTLHIDDVSGPGSIQVDGFHLLSETKQQEQVLDFMTGNGKDTVRVPSTLYGNLYAYSVTYNPDTGQLTFAPKAPQSSDGFAPGVLLQPLRSYWALQMLSQSLAPLRHRRESRFLNYDIVSSSFYLIPHMSGGKVEFTNGLSADTASSGLQAGWHSADWGLAERFAVTGGFNAGYQTGTGEYGPVSLDMQLIQSGANVDIYGERFYMGLTMQAASFSSEAMNDKQSQWAAWGEAEIGWHIPLSDNGWFLFPSALAGYGFVNKAGDIPYNGNTLYGKNFSLWQAKGGLEIIKSYNDVWHWYLNAAYVKQGSSQEAFQAAEQTLPVFETDPFIQTQAGFQTETDGRFALGAAVNAAFGSVQQIGAQITLQF